MKYKLILFSLIVLITVLSIETGFSQYREPLFKIHDRGELWETVKDNGQIGGLFSAFQFYPSMDWPGGPAILPNKDEQRSYCQLTLTHIFSNAEVAETAEIRRVLY